MNQETIGKFVAACRKEKGLTQKQLAEKLNITDRAVSKWETGKSIPDAAIMLDLCKILTISMVNLMRRHMLDFAFDVPALCGDISVALLPLFYTLIINAVLVPLYFELNHLQTKNAE